jgi:predicted DNA-binding transcriptional regulator YafY
MAPRFGLSESGNRRAAGFIRDLETENKLKTGSCNKLTSKQIKSWTILSQEPLMPFKWSDAKPAAKLLSLYSLLMISSRELTLTEISQKLNCSKQSVLRLIKQLEASRFGKVIVGKKGREACYRLDRPKNIPRVSLTLDGFKDLLMALNFIGVDLPIGMKKNIDSTLLQAAILVPNGVEPNLLEHHGRSFLGRINYTPFAEMLANWHKAIGEGRICAVAYRASLKEATEKFDFVPNRLKALHEALYVEGWKITKDELAAIQEKPQVLEVHRFQKVTLTGRSIPGLPVLRPGNFYFGLADEGLFKVKVKFSPEAATYAAEREWSQGENKIIHNDGSLTLTFYVRNKRDVLSWIFSFSDRATILKPKWLRQEVINKIQNMQNNYNTPAGTSDI